MSYVPADRIAVRTTAPIDPAAERRRVAEVFTKLAHADQQAAAEITAKWPRIIHQLARKGGLALPSFDVAA